MGLAPGAAMLVADAQATDGTSADATLSVPLQIVSATLSVNPLEPVTYLGEDTTLSFLLHAITTDEPNVGSGQPMAWSGSTGFTVSAGSSLTDALGETSMTAQAGPLAAGATEEVTACAWSIVCTQFKVVSIAAESWTIGIISGGQQAANRRPGVCAVGRENRRRCGARRGRGASDHLRDRDCGDGGLSDPGSMPGGADSCLEGDGHDLGCRWLGHTRSVGRQRCSGGDRDRACGGTGGLRDGDLGPASHDVFQLRGRVRRRAIAFTFPASN